jgi:hypothetical protein
MGTEVHYFIAGSEEHYFISFLSLFFRPLEMALGTAGLSNSIYTHNGRPTGR